MNPVRSGILGIVLMLGIMPAFAIDIAQKPVFLNPPDPRVMLLMSRDHELYKKAYTDYSDLDGDGGLETTYKDTIEYYGYFDTKRCYSYTGGRFEPAGLATGTNSHHCSGAWSGNFMNWATMTRMDVARKVLYGGLRSTDNNVSGLGSALGDTVLERTMLTSDVHAFAKVFAPAGGAAEVQLYIPVANAEVTLCSVSRPPIGTDSKNVTDPPVVRVTTGSWAQWAASEIVQCRTNGDSASDTDYTTRPPSATDYNVRVAVCVPGKLEANCKAYPSGAVKPVGLLQRYGDIDAPSRVRFGLMTGSYDNNKQGGVLRRNVSLIAGNATSSLNEIDSSSGQFTGNAGIIDTLNRLRISSFRFGHDLGTTNYNRYTDPTCKSPAKASFPNGECPDWGNPLSEMYLESLRYFAGESGPTTGFDTDDSGYLASTLPSHTSTASWSDPLPSTEWCAISNIVVLSTGLNSFDGDNLTNLPAGTTPAINIDTLTDMVGTAEGLAGATVFAGSNGGSATNKQCTAKTIGNLSDVSGICPEIPAQEGTYKIAGLANVNREVDLRPTYQTQRDARWGDDPSTTAVDPINANWAARQPLATYAVALAENLPSFSVKTQNGSTINFLPACQAHASWTPCTLTDVRVQSATATGGTFLAIWEDSQWGFDYDMDAISRVTWCVGSACSPGVGASEVKFTISVPQKVSGAQMRFGVIVNGSTNDGISSLLNGPGVNYNCTDSTCTASTPASAPAPLDLTYTAGASSAITLKNPLWYAAKYGAQASAWDLKDNDNPTLGPDGEPDNYFEVRNPANLEQALSEVFENAASADASASAIASNSTRLDTTTHIYQAVFNSPAWTGELKALPLTSGGTVGTASWEAGSLIPAAASRDITTWNGQAWNVATNGGRDFLWASLTSAQQTSIGSSAILDYLRGDQTNEEPSGPYRERTTLLGDIVNSDPHYVATESYGYDQPGSGLAATEQAAYTVFRTGTTGVTKVTRKKMLYVGANDGMLHAFNAANTTALGGGTELFAYVPNAVIPNLKLLSDPNYQHAFYVDGSPNSGDAYLNSQWRTVLLGTLGAGGKAVFALDVTDPDSFDSTKVMWEFTDSDLGHIMGRAHVARMNDGNWYAVFGNGYNSNGSASKAVLFLVPLDRLLGLPVIKIDTGVASDNGLSEPALLDEDGDRIIDTIYAGDLKGNVWKFDVSASNAGTWNNTGNRMVLFTATDASSNPQPITGALEIGAPPSGTGDYMIYFGTGKYLGNTDISDKSVQTAYGLLDSGSAISGRSALQSQEFVYEGVRTATDTSQIRVASDHAVTYTGASAQRGWYLDLLSPNTPAALGERIVSVPLLRFGRVILTSIVPSDAPCDQGGYSWITELDAMTGARLAYSVFDYNGDGTFDASDYAASAVTGLAASSPVSSKKLASEGLMKSPTVISAGEVEYKVGSGTAGGIVVVTEKGTTGSPRTSWRQIFAP